MPKRIDPVDILVGKNIRMFRLSRGLSQSELGAALGVTFQQVQKYERGTNRIGSSRLAKLAKFLKVPLNRIFEGVNAPGDASSEVISDLLSRPYAYRMLKALAAISSNKTRLSIVELAESIVDGGT